MNKQVLFHFSDRDECATGLHACPATATCENTLGAYLCRCGYGYYGVEGSCKGRLIYHIDGLAQHCSNSSALAMELLQFCAKPAFICLHDIPLKHYDMKMLSDTSLSLCEGNPLVKGVYPSQSPFDVSLLLAGTNFWTNNQIASDFNCYNVYIISLSCA